MIRGGAYPPRWGESRCRRPGGERRFCDGVEQPAGTVLRLRSGPEIGSLRVILKVPQDLDVEEPGGLQRIPELGRGIEPPDIAEGFLPCLVVPKLEVDVAGGQVVDRIECGLFPDVAERAIRALDLSPV